MELNVSEHYHKVLSHLIISGSNAIDSLAASLCSGGALTEEEVQKVTEEDSTKGKTDIILTAVISHGCEATFLRFLEDNVPQTAKSLMAQISNESGGSLRPESAGEGDRGQLLKNLEIVSCERDLINEELKNMSNKFGKVSEQLVQAQADSADLMRQNASDQQELAMLRRKSLIGGGGNPIINKMYENMLERYEELKSTHEILQQKLGDESKMRNDLQAQLDAYSGKLLDAQRKCSVIIGDHESLSRKFQGLNEKNEALQRDLHRVREERTLVKREYALVMSERDAVHREIEKLHEDINDVNRQLSESINEKKLILDEKERLMVQLNTLKQSQGTQQSTSTTNLLAVREELFVAQRERKQALAQYETQLHEAYTARKAQETAKESLLKLQTENEALTSKIESLTGELRDANNEAKDATRNRDMAFKEREKMRCERDEIKKTYDQLAEERERIMKQLESEIKEHDVTKEMKKRIAKELREIHRAESRGNAIANAGSRDNTDSHDSAIDAGEWGSEEISTLVGGGVHRRLRTFAYKLPRQPNITLETGLFVTQSNCRGIAISDRVVSINDTVVDSNNASQLQRLIPNSVNTCIVKVVRSSSPPPNESQSSREHNNISLNGDYGPLSVDSAVYTARQNVVNKPSTMDAECQTSQILRPQRNKSVTSTLSPIDTTNGSDVITPMIQRTAHHNSPSIACVSSGGESHQSISTYSDSTQHSVQTTQIPRQSSQKSSDSSVSFQRSSSAKREKKKSKASSRFWSRMKKSKSVSGPPKGASPGGTWPRLESPPPVGGGRLSVFTGKKRNRPSLSPTTFTPPPIDSVGRTPPTVIRGQPLSTPTSPDAPVTPRSFQETHPGAPPSASSGLTRHLRTIHLPKRDQKRQRPVSVPIDVSEQPLTLWTAHNASNNNNLTSQQRPQTPRASVVTGNLIDIDDQSGTAVSEPLPNDRSSISHDSSSILTNQSDRIRPSNAQPTMTPVQPAMTVEPTKRPHTIYFERTMIPSFLRQHSVPINSTSDKVLTLPESLSPRQQHRQGQRAKIMTSPTVAASLQPRTAHSLPRPSSAKTPTSRASSHQSVDTNKTKSLDYKRIRIPSEASVGKRLTGSEKGSISLSSDRSTPTLFNRSHSPATPMLHSPATPLLSPATPLLHPSAGNIHSSGTILFDPTVASIPGSTVSSISNISATSARGRRPPVTTDPRYVCMVKGTDPIGISIVGGGDKGGIFVSRITEDSLAARAGLEYGDQLLEYNGINLRCAVEAQARAIMSQTQAGDNITFLAQYNLEKYKSSIESNLSDSLGFLKTRKPNPALTPCDDNEGTITPDMTPRSSLQAEETLQEQPVSNQRYIFMNGNCSNIKLVGGNRSGVFVASFSDENMGQASGLKVADQILEYNSIDLRKATLERASLLLSKPAPNAALCVVYNNVGFSKLSMEPGDFFFVRALFDNIVETGSGNLSFSRNSILLVDNTYPEHTKGVWSAWQVDEQGEKTTRGKIPSKFMVERESGLQRDFDDSASTAGSIAGKKLGGTGRRSFFKRRKPHRNSSRSSGDIKLHKSVSETSIESTETSFEHMGAAYQVVEKHVSEHRRPVVVLGPHSANVCERLQREYGSNFSRCTFEALHSNTDIHDKNIIESFKQVTCTMALRIETVKREMQQHRHVLLEISQDAVDRLHSHRIYPIIIFIDYSSAKKIKESQDRYPGREKITMKQSRELFERANSIRKKLTVKYLGTVYIHGGSTAAVAKQIHTVVEHEQSKVLWLPAQHDLLNY